MNGSTETFRRQQSAHEARQQLDGWVPRSTPLADAVSALQAYGFACQQAQSAEGLRSATLRTLDPLPTPPAAQRDTHRRRRSIGSSRSSPKTA